MLACAYAPVGTPRRAANSSVCSFDTTIGTIGSPQRCSIWFVHGPVVSTNVRKRISRPEAVRSTRQVQMYVVELSIPSFLFVFAWQWSCK